MHRGSAAMHKFYMGELSLTHICSNSCKTSGGAERRFLKFIWVLTKRKALYILGKNSEKVLVFE
ncbi:MAG: hypothetical protein DCE90_05820 [Pseudanabaena sp.]|nr:MAG: hypothetical protein DCE90_05820 [Pseudanabaena sp.]